MQLAIGIGGAAGQGIATPGEMLARIFVRRGLHLKTYSAYQSIVRGGHILLTLRTSERPVLSTGDTLDLLITLNQDTMDRHLHLMRAGSVVLFNADKIQPGSPADGVQLCPFSVKELAPSARGDLVQNTIGLAAALQPPSTRTSASRALATTTPRATSRPLPLACRGRKSHWHSWTATRRWRWAQPRRACASTARTR